MKRRHVPLIVVSALFVLLLNQEFPAVAQEGILFERTWGGAGIDWGMGVAVDRAGNIYQTGFTISFGGAFILKFDPLGGLVWQRTWGGDGFAWPWGISADLSGNVYVAGSGNSSGMGEAGVFILKFDPSGNLLWQRAWGGIGGEWGAGLAVDTTGNAYVGGVMNTTTFWGTAVFLLKLNPAGDLLWQRAWAGNNVNIGGPVTLDSQSNVYLAGGTGPDSLASDVFILKFNSTGDLLWQRTWGGGGNEWADGVAVDVAGNTYLTGRTESYGAGGSDVFLLKFNSTGNIQWQRTCGSTASEIGSSLTIDSSGNILAAGATMGTAGRGLFDVLLLKFDPSGGLIWQRAWGSAKDERAHGAAVDSSGNLIASGFTSEPPPYSLTIPNNVMETPTFNTGTPSAPAETLSIPLAYPSGTVLIPSGSLTYGGNEDAFLLKYGTLPPTTTSTTTTTTTSSTTTTTVPATTTPSPVPVGLVNVCVFAAMLTGTMFRRRRRFVAS